MREDLHRRLVQQGLLTPDSSPKRVRKRDKVGMTPSRILEDGKNFFENAAYLTDGKQFVVEILEEEEDLKSEDSTSVCILVQRWLRSTWSLGPKFEAFLQGNLLSILNNLPHKKMQRP